MEYKNLEKLIETVRILRSPEGCEWDRAQTHKSLKPNMLEEAYEAVDAIDDGDIENLREELGDVLLQVLLHSQIADDNGEFNLDDVSKELNEKLIHRHPHVFSDAKVHSTDEILANWDLLKKEEKKDRKSAMDGISKSQSALMSAQKISKRAVKTGFEWPDENSLYDCIKSEFDEFKEAEIDHNKEHMEEELGDILFAVVNLARWNKIDAEQALLKSNKKFVKRFRKMEELAQKPLEEYSFIEYDKLIIATGADAVIPNFANKNFEKIYTLRTLDDGIALKEGMKDAKHITIVGGGYIAIELIEAFVKNKKRVTLVETAPFVLSMLDEDISSIIQEYILENSDGLVKIINEDTVSEVIRTKSVLDVITAKGYGFETDMVVVTAGIKPAVDIAREAGIELGKTGAIKVNSRMETNIKDIYACGDCAEKINMISNTPVWLPLGSTANKEGRVAAINVSGEVEDFEGVLGSAVLRYMALNISKTGLTEKEALKLGYDAVSVVITKRDRAGYMPEVKNVTLKIVADRRSHKILGAQAIGCGDADKRVNTVSIGLLQGITVEQLIDADLTYAPPFSTSIDILISAAQILKSKLY